MKRFTITLAALALFGLACQQSGPTSPLATKSIPGTASFSATSNGRVVSRVSVGGHDVDNSDDKNFSMIALLREDGTSDGQWVDMFGLGAGGIHVDVDCVNVSGDSATISGIIKHGEANGVDVTGQRALTRVWDIGKSANDPPDAISFSFFPVGVDCHFAGPLPALPMTKGQVTVD
jgi:hypothetical protein